MRRCWLVLLLVAGLMGAAPPIAAAVPVAVLSDNVCGPSDPNAISVCGARVRRDDVVQLHALAACVVDWLRPSSAAAVSAYVRSGETRLLPPLLASAAACPSYTKLRVSPVLLAGAIAEALLAGAPRGAGPATGGTGTATLTRRPAVDGSLTCLMQVGHEDAQRLIRTPLYSHREEAATARLVARWQPCLSAGEEVRTSPAVLRAVIALRLWAARMPAAAPGEAAPLALASLSAPPLALSPAGDHMATPVDLIPNPSLTIGPERVARQDPSPFLRPHPAADLPEKFDPEDDIDAATTLPVIDERTGETAALPTRADIRRSGDNPY